MDSWRNTETDDRSLANAIRRRGDEAAFRRLYRRHTPRLLGFVRRLLGRSQAEAEDVVQDVWIRACDGLQRFRWECSFSTWLLGIGLNVVRERHRQESRRPTAPLNEAAEQSARFVARDDRIDVAQCVASLPDGYRTVLVLHDVEGLKHREIAERLGISDGTSKSQLSNARRMMRTMLAGAQGGRE